MMFALATSAPVTQAASTQSSTATDGYDDQAALSLIEDTIQQASALNQADKTAEGIILLSSAKKDLMELSLRPWHKTLLQQPKPNLEGRPKQEMIYYIALFRSVSSDLNFKPLEEAKLPEGYPDVGPVGEVVEKSYPAYRMAYAEGRGSFGRLFRHIQRRDIPMTAPVEMTGDQGGSMGFLYESVRQGNAGDIDQIEVVDRQPMTVLSMAVRGKNSPQSVELVKGVIVAYAQEHQIAISDEWRVLGYSSPRIPAGRRYYEVQVSLKEPGE